MKRESRARTAARTTPTGLALVGGPGTENSRHEGLNGAEAGLLFLPHNVSHLYIGSARERDDLYTATFSGPPPAIDARGGLVRVAPRPRDGFSLHPLATELLLNSVIPWEIDARRDIFSVYADLTSIDLRGACVRGAARDVTLRLGAPYGRVPLRIAGGVRRLELRLPAGSSASIRFKHEPTRSRFEADRLRRRSDSRFVRIGAGDDARDHYTIELLGDCDRVTVTTLGAKRAAA